MSTIQASTDLFSLQYEVEERIRDFEKDFLLLKDLRNSLRKTENLRQMMQDRNNGSTFCVHPRCHVVVKNYGTGDYCFKHHMRQEPIN